MQYPFWVLLFFSVGCMAIIERVLHALCMLLWHIFHSTDSDLKTNAAMNMFGGILIGGWDVALDSISMLGNVIRSILTSAVWIIVFSSIALTLTALYEFSPTLCEGMLILWNSTIGPVMYTLVLLSSRILYILAYTLIPIWNASIWAVSKLLTTLVLPAVEIDYENFLRASEAAVLFCTHVVQSFSNYLQTFTACTPVSHVVDVSCFEPGLRTLDVLTPMLDVRNFVAYTVLIIRTNCRILGSPIDLVVYPFYDINFAKALHNIINVPLFVIFQLPVVTFERCKYSTVGSGSTGTSAIDGLMCVPDIEPVFRFASSGILHMGRLLDNWIDIALVIIEEVFTGQSVSCGVSVFSIDSEQLPATDAALFGNNRTIFVGLTPGLYARTDGWAAKYTTFYKKTEQLLVQRAWPIPVDVKHGIAAVVYSDDSVLDDAAVSTTAMLGCACYDIPDSAAPAGTRMEITCAITPFEAESFETIEINLQDYLLPVNFAVTDANLYLECRRVRISVQSVRWPVTRVAAPDAASGIMKNVRDKQLEYADEGVNEQPTQIDAVVYVVPRCRFGAEYNSDVSDDMLDAYEEAAAGTTDAACIEAFKYAGCFPHCFAARPTRSMNSALTLYDRDVWQDSVLLLNRDCGLGEVVVPQDISQLLDNGISYRARTDSAPTFSPFEGVAAPLNSMISFLNGNIQAGQIVTSKPVAVDAGSRGACTYNKKVVSRVQKASLSAYGGADDALISGAWAADSVRLEAQPFAFGGDAQLLVEWEDDKAFIRVQRLYGADNGHITLLTYPSRIPTVGTCRTLADCAEVAFDPSRVVVPRAYSASAADSGPSVATKWSVFYATNPSPEIYSQYFRWCQLATNAGLQFQKDSSYGPPRVWRVDAFASAASTPPSGVPSFVELDGFSKQITWENCATRSNMSVEALSFLNDFNVAITALIASPRWYDLKTRAPLPNAPVGSGEVEYKVYYLNPQTMQLRADVMWDPDATTSALAQGQLCPAMRRMPNVGSFLAEVLVSSLYFIRVPVAIVVYIPSVTAIGKTAWYRLTDCPIITRGHTVLRECGRDIFSLAPAFDAALRANTHFWRSLSIIAALFDGMPNAEYSKTFLNGAAVVGTNKFDGTVLAGSALQSILAVSRKTSSRMPASLRSSMRYTVTGLGFSRYIYELFEDLIMRIIVAESGKSLTGRSLGDRVADVLWNTMYDSMVRWKQLVIIPAQNTCDGFSIMLGWSNPFAEYVRHQCRQTVAISDASLTIATVFFVDYPVMSCLCGMPGGVQFTEQAMTNCFDSAPLEYHPIILGAVQIALGNSDNSLDFTKAMCITFTTFANERLYNAPNMVFSEMFDVAASLEPMFDYLQIFNLDHRSSDSILRDDNGVCSNFYTSPFVMTLMPYPLDFFRVCGETPPCKLRCFDLISAFEEARGRAKTRYGGSQSTFNMLVEQPFFTEEDIDNGRVRPPFEVMALAELQSCVHTCGESTSPHMYTRCFVAAGRNTFDQVAFSSYCMPSSAGTGIRQVESWSVANSETWSSRVVDMKMLGAREEEDYYYDHTSAAAAAAPDLAVQRPFLLVMRTDGVFIANPSGTIRRIMRIMDNDEAYISAPHDAIHFVDATVILFEQQDNTEETNNATTQLSRYTHVIISGSSKVLTYDNRAEVRDVCWRFRVNLDILSATQGVDSPLPCPPSVDGSANTVSMLSMDLYAAVTVLPYGNIMLLPLQDGDQMQLCDGIVISSLQLVNCERTAVSQTNLASDGDIAGAASQPMNVFTRAGRIVRMDTIIAQTATVIIDMSAEFSSRQAAASKLATLTAQESRGYRRVFTTLSTAFADITAAWISDIRVEVPASASGGVAGGAVSMQRSTSSSSEVGVTFERECAVMSCGGCADKSTQRLCYAAQSCAVSKCVGTTVNMNRPLCMTGAFFKEKMEAYTSALVSAWITIFEMFALIIDAGTGVLGSRVELQFPYHIVNTIICEGKDIVITILAVFTSSMNNMFTIIFNNVFDMSTAVLTETTAQTTLMYASMTNFFAHLLYFPFNILAVGMQVLTCNTNQIISLIDFSGFEIRIGTLSQMRALGHIGGKCQQSFASEAASEYGSSAAAKSDLQKTIERVRSSARSFARETATLADNSDAQQQVHSSGTGSTFAERAAESIRFAQGFRNQQGSWIPSTGSAQTGILSKTSALSYTQPTSSRSTYSSSTQTDESVFSKVSNQIASLFMITVDLMVHIYDGTIVYLIGVVRTLADFIAVVAVSQCKLPDLTAQDAPLCACGDTPARIPLAHGLKGLSDSAFWCTGVLQLTAVDGSAFIVFNPYTFEELRAIASTNMQRYLECISTGGQSEETGGYSVSCSSLEPHAQLLLQQGASTLQVLTRCKANYVNRQWDIAAALLFRYEDVSELRNAQSFINFSPDSYKHPEVAACMQTAASTASEPDRCLTLFLQTERLTPDEYFAYEGLTGADAATMHLIDACKVFTGPAAAGFQQFQDCIDDTRPEAQCGLEYIVWAGRSSNKVPVATTHIDISKDNSDDDRFAIATSEIRSAQTAVRDLITDFLSSDWSQGDIAISLFSSEGDALHQMFDCLILGPYGVSELWPNGPGLPAPLYSRRPDAEVQPYIDELYAKFGLSAAAGSTYAYSYTAYDDIYLYGDNPWSDEVPRTDFEQQHSLIEQLSREFQLPCTGDRLEGDDKVPFTCGSSARRAIIKHFVRDIFGSDDDDDTTQNGATAIVIQETIESFMSMRERWGVFSNFGCPCPDDSADSDDSTPSSTRQSIECCSEDNIAGWSHWRQLVMGDEIVTGEELGATLMDHIVKYTQNEMITDTYTATNKYSTSPTGYTWNVQQMILAADLGLLDASEPVRTFGADEAIAPSMEKRRFSAANEPRNASLWDLCTGIVSTTMFSMPIAQDPSDTAQWRPDTVFTSPDFSPTADNAGLYSSSIEAFVRDRLLRSAEDRSPVFWQYALRHAPSKSMVCLGLDADAPETAAQEAADTAETAGDPIQIHVDTSTLPTAFQRDHILETLRASSDLKPNDPDPAFAYIGAFARRLGSLDTTCVCGWRSATHTGMCSMPQEVCSTIQHQSAVTSSELDAEFALELLHTVCATATTTTTTIATTAGTIINGETTTVAVHTYDPSIHFWAATAAVDFFFSHTSQSASSSTSLTCDSMSPSDAWGVLERAQAIPWVAANTADQHRIPEAGNWEISLRDVLTAGRSGVRITSMYDILETWHRVITPAVRQIPLTSQSEPNATVAQRLCGDDVASKLVSDLSQRYVDDLFPVAQGVKHSVPAIDYCTRYAIEIARSAFLGEAAAALRLHFSAKQDSEALDTSVIQTVESITNKQDTVIAQWRTRCENQINMLAMCELRGVYDTTEPPHAVGPGNASALDGCPFRISDWQTYSGRVFVTPGCAVYLRDAFYNPCLCSQCGSTTVLTADYIRGCPSAIYVRDFVSQPQRGGGMHWATQWAPSSPEIDALAQRLEIATRQSSTVPSLNGINLAKTVLDDGMVGGAADPPYHIYNTKRQKHWATEEGRAETSVEDCDLFLDWWPEDWTQPAGYHVTTQPFSDQAGYRVFDNAFAVQRDGYDKVYIVYEHDAFRNRTLMRDFMGAGGVCNRDTFGMPLVETNNVRTCMSVSKDDLADPTVPIKSTSSNPDTKGKFFPETCSDQSINSMWKTVLDDKFAASDSHNPSTLRNALSSGLTNLWYDFVSAHWPPRQQNKDMHIRDKPLQSLATGGETFESASDAFGGSDECFHPSLFQCSTDSQCKDLAIDEAAQKLLVCRNGVCALSRQTSLRASDIGLFDCTSHSDCTGDLMCSGWGRCVQPMIEITNRNAKEIEAQVFAAGCASERLHLHREDMFGSSPWERIDDLLTSSGMCSQRAWYEQRDLFAQKDTCIVQETQIEDSCVIDSHSAAISHTDTLGPVSRGSIWDEHRLLVQATQCDRDYMHLSHDDVPLAACRPTDTTLLYTRDEADPQAAPKQGNREGNMFATVLRTHSRSDGFSGEFQQPIDPATANPHTTAPLFADNALRDAAYGFINLEQAINYTHLLDPSINSPDRLEYLAMRDSIFRFCSEISQCVMQPFTVNGFPATERLAFTAPGIAGLLGKSKWVYDNNPPEVAPIRFLDVFACGAMGRNTVDEKGEYMANGECILDPAVTLLYYAICQNSAQKRDNILQKCGTQFRISSSDFVSQTVCSTKDSDGMRIPLPFYQRAQRDAVAQHINWIQGSALNGGIYDFNDYLDKVECANAIFDSAERTALLQGPSSLVRINSDEDAFTHTVPRGMYYIQDTFALTEFPFAWWFKCFLLSGITMQASAIVQCPAWEYRTRNPDEIHGSVRQFLQQFDGVITREMFAAASRVESAEDTCDLSSIDEIDPSKQPSVISQRLSALFREAREYLIQYYQLSTKRIKYTCRSSMNYNLDYLASVAFQSWVFDSVYPPSDGVPPPVRPEFVTHEGQEEYTHGDIVSFHDMQATLCNFWFAQDPTTREQNAEDDWVTVFTPQLTDPVDAKMPGIAFARFNRLNTKTIPTSTNPEFGAKCARMMHIDECIIYKNSNLDIINWKESSKFCIYQTDKKSDSEYLRFTANLPYPLQRPYVVISGASDPENLFSDIGGLEKCLKDTKWKTGMSFDSNHRKIQYNDICSDMNIPFRVDKAAAKDPDKSKIYILRRDTSGNEKVNIPIAFYDADAFGTASPAHDELGQQCKLHLSPEKDTCRTAYEKFLNYDFFYRWTERFNKWPPTVKCAPNGTTLIPAREFDINRIEAVRGTDVEDPWAVFNELVDATLRHNDTTDVCYGANSLCFFGELRTSTLLRLPPGVNYEMWTGDSSTYNPGLYVDDGVGMMVNFIQDGNTPGYISWLNCPTDDVPKSKYEVPLKKDPNRKSNEQWVFEGRRDNQGPQYKYMRSRTDPPTMYDVTASKIFTRQNDDSSALDDVRGLRLQLMQNTFCCEHNCEAQCGEREIPIQIAVNLWHCMHCTKAPRTYCKGVHDCMIAPIDSPHDHLIDENLAWDEHKEALLRAGINVEEATFTEQFIDILHIIAVTYMQQQRAAPVDDMVRILPRTDEAPFFTEPPNLDAFHVFNSIPAKQFLSSISAGASKDISSCANADSIAQFTDYSKCNNEDIMLRLKEFTDKEYRKAAFVSVPPKHTVAWPTSHHMHTNHMLFAFAARDRRIRDRFASYILDTTLHCAKGTIYDTLCLEDSLGRPIPFNPWLGGDFNPFDLCDTSYDPARPTTRFVDTRCNRVACPNIFSTDTSLPRDRYLREMPQHCTQRNLQEPHTATPRESIPNNICFLTPRVNATCEHFTGVLGGQIRTDNLVVDGTPVSTLYAETDIAGSVNEGGLLFVPQGATTRHQGQPTRGRNRLLSGETKQQVGFTKAEAATIRVHSQDIAGHHLRLELADDDILRVSHVVLSEAADALLDLYSTVPRGMAVPSAPVAEWMNEIEGVFAIEHSRIARRVPPNAPSVLPTHIPWDCALRRLRYWSNQLANPSAMRPVFPDPRRTQHVFGRLNTLTFAHPLIPDADTQTDRSPVSNRADVYTANGFCTCQTEKDCSLRTSMQGKCSLTDTINFLADRKPRTLTVLGDSCPDQIDWPFINASLRDGGAMPNSRHMANCSVLDRLPAFALRTSLQDRSVQSAIQTLASRFGKTLTTLDEGGDCHTGRAATMPSAGASSKEGDQHVTLVSRRCHLQSKNTSHLTLRCDGRNSHIGPHVTDFDSEDEILVIPRERSATLAELTQQARTTPRMCAFRSPLPEFWAQRKRSNTLTNSITSDKMPIPASSFGEPWRISSERILSSDLLRQLCSTGAAPQPLTNGHTIAPFCSQPHIQAIQNAFDGALTLNGITWTVGSFLHTLLHAPQDLLQDPVSHADARGINYTRPPSPWQFLTTPQEQQDSSTGDEATMFNTPWIGCSRHPTNGTITECMGNMTAATWADARSRAGYCKSEISQAQKGLRNNLVADLPICDLTSSTDRLCSQIAEYEYKVLDSHCFAAGMCSRSSFFYSPSVYSVSNSEFVRETVQSFYRGIDDNSCPQFEERLERLIEQNNEMRQKCPALALEAIESMLQAIRKVLQQMVDLLYYILLAIMNLLRLLGSGSDFDEIMDAIIGAIKKIVVSFMNIILAIGNIVFEIAMESPFGKILRVMITKICDIISWIQNEILSILICPFMDGILGVLDSIDSVISGVKNWSFMGGKPFGWIQWHIISNFISETFVALGNCDNEHNLKCSWERTWDTINEGAYQNPTRCWAQYVTFLGDESDLACSAADSCAPAFGASYDDDILSLQPVVCDACPIAPSGVDDFGCDPITKVCACSVPRIERTSCVNHRQCRDEQTATCNYVDNDLTQTFSTIPCKTCSSEPMCIISPTDSSSSVVGYCSCMLRPQGAATCSLSAVGERVSYNPSDLCLTGIGSLSGVSATSVSYSAEYDRLAAMPCYMADLSQSYCYNVWLGPFTYVPRIVVLERISLTSAGVGSPFRRRRLLLNDMITQDMTAQDMIAQEYAGEDLFAANNFTHHNTTTNHSHSSSSSNNNTRRQLHNVSYFDFAFHDFTNRASGWVHQAWDDATGLCADVVAIWRRGNGTTDHMSATDKVALQQCLYWRNVADLIIRRYNLTDVSDHFLLSWADFSVAVSDFHTLAQIIGKPRALIDAAAHSPMLAPVFAVARLAVRWAEAYAVVLTSAQPNSTKPTFLNAMFSFANAVVHQDINWGMYQNRDNNDTLLPLFTKVIQSQNEQYAKYAMEMRQFLVFTQSTVGAEGTVSTTPDSNRSKHNHLFNASNISRSYATITAVPNSTTMPTTHTEAAQQTQQNATKEPRAVQPSSASSPPLLDNSISGTPNASLQNDTFRFRQRRLHAAASQASRTLTDLNSDDDSSWKTRLSTGDMFASEVLLNGGDGRARVPAKVGVAWVTGAIQWPPDYSFYHTNNLEGDLGEDLPVCPGGAIVGEVLGTMFTNIGQFYSKSGPKAATPERNFYRAFPRLKTLTESSSMPASAPNIDEYNATRSDLGIWALMQVRVVLEGWFGVSADPVYEIAGLAPEIITDMLVCDLDEVQFCTRYHRTAWVSLMWMIVFSIGAGIILNTLGVQYLTTMIIFVIPLGVLYLSTGYGLLCSPMLPPCLLTEMVEIVTSLFPLYVHWPSALQTSPNCVADKMNLKISTDTQCLIPCSAPPHLYTRWEAPFAWWLCDFHVGVCRDTQHFLATNASGLFPVLENYIEDKASIIEELGDDSDMATAQRLCATLTSWYIMPWVLLFTLATYFVVYLVSVPISMFRVVVRLTCNVIIYSHTHKRLQSDNMFERKAVKTAQSSI